MTRAALKAGRYLVRDFGEVSKLQVSRKGAYDFVSRADLSSERILCQELQAARPSYGVLAEESGAHPGADPTWCWIVDPLDGTTNFLHGLPHWGVSVGLEHKGKIIAGVIYEPLRDEMFWAEKGQGAFLNGQRIRVSERQRPSESLFATGFKLPPGQQQTRLTQLASISNRSAGVRRMGAAALDLAYVAAGRYEGFWDYGCKPWDVAAGIILVLEAGGMISAAEPDGDPLRGESVLAANRYLFSTLLMLLSGQTVPQGDKKPGA